MDFVERIEYMGSLTKTWRDRQEAVKQMIVDGQKRGICNNEGQSRNHPEFGIPVPKPKVCGKTAFHKEYPRHGTVQ